MTILSSGIIPVRRIDDEHEVLLLRCFNYWDFPKGEVDPREKPLHAALRELEEETGIESVTLFLGEIFKETLPYSKGKIARYYIGLVDPGVRIRLSSEHHGFKWISFQGARSQLVPRLQDVLDWVHKLISMKA